MERKILISVDDSRHARYAVKYCAHLALKTDSLTLQLLNIQTAISQFLVDDCKQDMRLKQELNKVLSKNKETSEQILEKFKQEIIDLGIAPERIVVQSLPRDLGVAKDIMKCGENGQMDAVVMGRRGLSALQEMVLGSVSSNIIQHCTFLPIWLVGSDAAPQNILVAVDGSENSLRAIDHLAFMMSGAEDVRFTLFHVKPLLKEVCPIDFSKDISHDLELMLQNTDQRCLDQFYPRAMKKFSDQGISSDRISTKTQEGLVGVKSAIVKEIKNGGYDTIVLGRRGSNNRFFTGSISNHIVNKVTDRVIWLVP